MLLLKDSVTHSSMPQLHTELLLTLLLINYFHRSGDRLNKTINYLTSPGRVELVAETEEQLLNDYTFIHSLDEVGLLEIDEAAATSGITSDSATGITAAGSPDCAAANNRNATDHADGEPKRTKVHFATKVTVLPVSSKMKALIEEDEEDRPEDRPGEGADIDPRDGSIFGDK